MLSADTEVRGYEVVADTEVRGYEVVADTEVRGYEVVVDTEVRGYEVVVDTGAAVTCCLLLVVQLAGQKVCDRETGRDRRSS